MNRKKVIFIIFITLFLMIMCNNISFAGNQRLHSLEYEVLLNSDGSANITEIWDIQMNQTNTLFKTFNIDKSKYSKITDVKIEEISSHSKLFNKINQEMYHVTKDSYYALVNNNGKFEIAWGVNAKNERKKYKISYKVTDVVKKYTDCNEFYWAFVDKTNGIPSEKVTGTIKLPSKVLNKENIRAWAHGPLNGDININNEDTISFNVEDLDTNTYIEVRVVTLEDIFTGITNVSNINKFDSILKEETKWAEESNKSREIYRKKLEQKKSIEKSLKLVSSVIGTGIAIIFAFKIKKYLKAIRQVKEIKPENEVEYFRDFPNPKETPAETAFVYYSPTSISTMQNNITKILSATMLDLCIKGLISFEVIEKNNINVELKKEEKVEELKETEKKFYKFLMEIPKDGKKHFTMKEFEKYSKNNPSKFTKILKDIEEDVKKEQEDYGNYDKEIKEYYDKWLIRKVLYIFATVISFILGIFLVPMLLVTGIASLVNAILCSIVTKRYNTLTQKGVNEKEMLQGLKKYLDDFSMIDEKTVPDIILWEKYLVYATVFGIAEKVIKQLKIKYPQIVDTDINTSSYMYLIHNSSLNMIFISTLNNSMSTAYTTNIGSNSSGEGYGGGFSGGGGFGGGGGRNGWKISFNIIANMDIIIYLC